MNFSTRCRTRAQVDGGHGVFQQFVPDTRKRHGSTSGSTTKRGRTTPSSSAELSAPRPEQHRLRGGQRSHQPAHPRQHAQHRLGRSAAGRNLSADDGQRVPRGLQLRQLEAAEHVPGSATSRRSWHRERAEPRRDRLGLPVVPLHEWHVRPTTSPTRAEREPHAPPERLLFSDNLYVDQGRALAQGRRPLDAQHGADGFGFGVNFRGQYRFSGARRATRSSTSCSGCRCDVPRSGDEPRTARWPLRTTSRCSVQDDWRVNQEPHGVPRPALRGRGRLARERDLLANFNTTDGGYHVVPNETWRRSCRRA